MSTPEPPAHTHIFMRERLIFDAAASAVPVRRRSAAEPCEPLSGPMDAVPCASAVAGRPDAESCPQPGLERWGGWQGAWASRWAARAPMQLLFLALTSYLLLAMCHGSRVHAAWRIRAVLSVPRPFLSAARAA